MSQDSYPRQSIPRKERKLSSNYAVRFSKSTWHHVKVREKRVHREVVSISVSLMSVAPSSRRGHKRNLAPRKMRPQSSMGLGKDNKFKKSDKTTFYSPIEVKAMLEFVSK